MTQKQNEFPDQDDQKLNDLFRQSRSADPVPSVDLMARILADAAHVQAELAENRQHQTPEPSIVGKRLASFGGWGGASALTASICLGLFFGIAAPDTVMAYVPGIETSTGGDIGFLDVFSDLGPGEAE